MPPVSVLMPVYNAERFLRPAIDSVLSQTHRDFELIIVDDGSTDRSREIVRSYDDGRIRLVALEQHGGLSEALNAGLGLASGGLVARQDADDVSEPHRLERQLAVMRAQPELALLGSQAVAMNEDGKSSGVVWRPTEPASIRWYGLFDNPFAHTSVVFRTSVVRDELGGFETAYDPFSQDYALWCRLMERHAFANLPDRLVRYRVNVASVIGSLEPGQRDPGYRDRFASIVRELVARNARRTMGEVVSAEDAGIMAGFVLGVTRDQVEPFLDVFDRLLGAFRVRHPGAYDRPDFRDTLARQFDALALRVTPPTRRSTGAIYAHALSRHPALATYLSWPRALALVTLGKGGRDRLASWNRAT